MPCIPLTLFLQHFLSRFSDNCAGQFKSQYTNDQLLKCAPYLGLTNTIINWSYFEPDHGEPGVISLYILIMPNVVTFCDCV